MSSPSDKRVDYNGLATDYARLRSAYSYVVDALLARAGLTPNSRVLEVGCGTGNYTEAVHAVTGCECWGLDISEDMLRHARERSTRIHWQAGRAEAFHFADRLFDFVYSVDAIHHFSDAAEYFKCARRALVPGGRICTVTDSESNIRNRQPMARYFPGTIDADLKRYPSITALRQWMQQAGFELLEDDQVESSAPAAHIERYRHKGYSVLHLISDEEFSRGMREMDEDVKRGPIPSVGAYTLLLWGRAPDKVVWAATTR